MTIDEAIAQEKANAEKLRKIIETGYDGEISIESIFCDDTSAIKEAYERFENCAKEHEHRAEWLEELKALRNGLKIKCDNLNEALEKGKKIGYNKALDDFVKFASDMPTVEEEDGTIRPMRLEEMAEQLKAGGKNETDNT